MRDGGVGGSGASSGGAGAGAHPPSRVGDGGVIGQVACRGSSVCTHEGKGEEAAARKGLGVGEEQP